MKINKVRFKNINSLRGEHTVDFTTAPLNGAGLFAITGPTGSGKTTLLDVICLALFSRVPRIAKPITKSVVIDSGAILTRNTQDCYAEVEYECKKGVFRSKWEISTARTGNLRDYDMFVSELPNDKIIDAKKSEVPGINEQNIGLHFDQFVKSMMLAQGDFAKFLQSDKRERSALLEKITGTNIYRELGKKAFEKYRTHGLLLDDLRKEHQVFKDQLLDHEKKLAFEKEHSALKAQIDNIEKELKELNNKKNLILEVEKLEKELEHLNDEKATLDKKKKAFDALEGEKITKHEALIPVANDLNEWIKTNEKENDLRLELEQVENAITTVSDEIKITNTSIKQLVGTDYNEKDIIGSIGCFQEKTNALLTEMQELRMTFTEAIGNLKPLKMHGVAFDPQDLNSSIENYNNSKQKIESELTNLKTELQSIELNKMHESLGWLDDRIELLKNAIPLQGRSEEQNKRLEKLSTEIQNLNTQIENLPKAIKDAKQAFERQERIVKLVDEKMILSLRVAELETHREHLKNGEPCPLCGALEHPFAVEKQKEPTQFEKELAEEKAKLSKFHSELVKLETELSQTQNQLKNVQEEFETEQETLKQIAQQLDSALQNFTSSEIDNGLENLSDQLKNQRAKLQDYINKSEKLLALKNTTEDVKALKEAFEKGMLKRQEFAALYPKSEKELATDIQNLRDGWNSLNQQLKSQNEQLEKEQKAFSEIEKSKSLLSQKLINELKPLGYERIENAIENRLSESDFNQLKKIQSELVQSLKLNAQAIAERQRTITEKRQLTDSLELETLNLKLETLNSEKFDKSETLNALDRQLKNHKDNSAKVTELQTQIIEAEKKGKQWVLLNQFIGDATGNKFNQFAQDLTLSQLIVLANRRLAGLNDRYLLDKAKDDEDDSLMVVDQHMGNERRSVKTLSGGETFLMSLSLALALSDLASRNVEINSLFIDEGFGTLDPEILDQTLDTLEKLQSEGQKTIGIISHVEALKERINTQIKLVRNGQGFSTLEVQG
ncbi:MAG: AAA family ATPase [Bacteroidetes bacterium]|nr:AAA family ATPase [Bacteroidota bacterium]